ncbi:MAG: Holliday junction resolvase RuvX [Bacteroidetes bacterium]|nr:MAG: Holliday junction resolvase RuvX [Bacteroidota bacterium]
MSEPLSRAMGIDYGAVRVGVSLSDPLRIIAQGLTTLPNDGRLLDELVRLIGEHGVGTVVIGNPLHLSGRESESSVAAVRFADALRARTQAECVLVDERFTSVIAHQTLRTMGTTRKQRRDKGRVDEMASAILLQGYLDRSSRHG